MSLVATRTIRLRRLEVSTSIGVLAHELESRQPVIFDVELDLAEAKLQPKAVSIARVLDYRQVREIIIEEAQSSHIALVEALVDRVAVRLIELDNVACVRVAAYKPDAFNDCDEVGVEVFVRRDRMQP